MEVYRTKLRTHSDLEEPIRGAFIAFLLTCQGNAMSLYHKMVVHVLYIGARHANSSPASMRYVFIFWVSVQDKERLQQLIDYQLLKKFVIRHTLLYCNILFNRWSSLHRFDIYWRTLKCLICLMSRSTSIVFRNKIWNRKPFIIKINWLGILLHDFIFISQLPNYLHMLVGFLPVIR